jgi:hypothetical protein
MTEGAFNGYEEANHKARVAAEMLKDPSDRYNYDGLHAVSVVGRRFNEDLTKIQVNVNI